MFSPQPRLRCGRHGLRCRCLGYLRASLLDANRLADRIEVQAPQYLFGWRLGIDELMFRDTSDAFNAIRGRMSPYTAFAFAAGGAAQHDLEQLGQLIARDSDTLPMYERLRLLVQARLEALAKTASPFESQGLEATQRDIALRDGRDLMQAQVGPKRGPNLPP